MQTSEASVNKKLKYSNLTCNMPQADTALPDSVDGHISFPIEKIVQNPLPGYSSPTSVNFSPDDNLISFLFSPEQTLNRKIFIFDLTTSKQELYFSPPDGGLDEDNLSEEEKFRRERSRERGLGVTGYEWVKTSSKTRAIPIAVLLAVAHGARRGLARPRFRCSPCIFSVGKASSRRNLCGSGCLRWKENKKKRFCNFKKKKSNGYKFFFLL